MTKTTTSSTSRLTHRAANAAGPITLTDAFLVDANDDPVTAPDKGEEVFVEADFDTQGVPAGASYKISYSIDGVTLETPAITFGAGDNSTESWFYYLGGWYASPGTHNVMVSIDPTTYGTSTKAFSFTPVTAPDLPHKFITPLGGTPQQSWGIVNYVDVNPLDSAYADYKGGDYTYDGHTGHDMTLADFSLMDGGTPDYAAAAGTVVTVQDGNYDRNTVFNSSANANYVEIDHGNGWHTFYYHMRTDTILVHVGDKVVAGQVLGLAGSSGYSTAAHEHFELQHNGDVVEEEYDPTTYWANPLPYQGTLTSVLASGVTGNHTPTINDLDAEERPVSANTFTQAANQQLTIWMESFTRNNDAVSFQFYAPDGSHQSSMDYSFTATEAPGGYWYEYQTLPSGMQLGNWQAKVVINGTVMATDPFYVTAGGAGAARVTQGTTTTGTDIPNGRTTPVDFGTVAKGATAPQQTFTISNLGSAALSLANLSLPAGFSAVGSLPSIIAAGGTAALTLQMSTAASATQAGVVSFNTSDPTAPTYRFAVKGVVSGGNAGEVHGQVFLDYNKDGIENNADTGLSGWTVTLYNALTSNVIGTTATGFNGYYAFYNLSSATYQVRETPPAGATQTTTDPANVTVSSNDVLSSPLGISLPAEASSLTAADLLGNGKVAGSTTAGQQSNITRLLVSFNQPVSLGTGAFTLSLLNTGGSGANDGSAPTDASAALGTPVMVAGSGGTQWYVPVVSNTNYSNAAASLNDGIYTLTVHAAAVTANGAALPGGDQAFTFHRLYGDLDGNKTVNPADYARLKTAFGSAVSSSAYNADLDYDNNGTINPADYAQFKLRFGKTFTYT